MSNQSANFSVAVGKSWLETSLQFLASGRGADGVRLSLDVVIGFASTMLLQSVAKILLWEEMPGLI